MLHNALPAVLEQDRFLVNWLDSLAEEDSAEIQRKRDKSAHRRSIYY